MGSLSSLRAHVLLDSAWLGAFFFLNRPSRSRVLLWSRLAMATKASHKSARILVNASTQRNRMPALFAALLSYEAPNNGSVDCLTVRSTVVTYDVWVHWAFVVNENNGITGYINGSVSTAMRPNAAWCGVQGGTMYLGQSRNPNGPGFNPADAPRVAFNSIRIHRVPLTSTELAVIAGGGAARGGGFTRTAFWDAWCFRNSTGMGFDAGTQRRDMTLMGGSLTAGPITCSVTPLRGAVAWRTGPSDTYNPYNYAKTGQPWLAPAFPFTIEAWVKVQQPGEVVFLLYPGLKACLQ